MSNKLYIKLRHQLTLLAAITLAACAGNSSMAPATKAPTAPAVSVPAKQAPATTPVKEAVPTPEPKPGSGGYYLDDGPGENAPANIDGIPGATLKTEQPYKRSNKPYSALGQQYTPATSYAPYKKQGIASWYGKRFHGKKTSTGEIYDMYAMSAAHTVLPIPSYAKVTNPANGRSVIVRINDRGPFKRDRLIDLSYAAAYQLRLIKQGQGLVEVETIDTSPEALRKITANKSAQTASTSQNAVSENTLPRNETSAVKATTTEPAPTITPVETAIAAPLTTQYYVQAGAFKNEANGDLLQKRIQSLQLGENVGVANVYNDGLYRVKLGPYSSKSEADISAANIRRELNTAAHVTN